jgi:hypothetical protein
MKEPTYHTRAFIGLLLDWTGDAASTVDARRSSSGGDMKECGDPTSSMTNEIGDEDVSQNAVTVKYGV